MDLLQKMELSKNKAQEPSQNEGKAAALKKVSLHDNGGCCGSCGGQKESDKKGDKS